MGAYKHEDWVIICVSAVVMLAVAVMVVAAFFGPRS